jgi:uncharacterized repeat protein (TIGR03803 family)
VLHSFAGVDAGDGGQPNGGLVFGDDGALYGTTVIGGYDCPFSNNQGCGTLFKLAPSDGQLFWNESVLYQFLNGDDGKNPNGNLIIDHNADLFGTTHEGGDSKFASGTVMEFQSQPNGTYLAKSVYTFLDGSDGGLPAAGLALDKKGNGYGGATSGGDQNCGALFRIQRASGAFQTIYEFQGLPDSCFPASHLIFKKNNLYGTTSGGGMGQSCGTGGCGTVYMIGP